MSDTSMDTAVHTTDTPQVLLEHHLKELRLPTILRETGVPGDRSSSLGWEYDRVARQCAVEQVNYPRYLLGITELELLDRERRATDRRIPQAKFPVVKSLDSFDFLAIPTMANKPALIAWAVRTSGEVYGATVFSQGKDGNHVVIPTFPYDCRYGQ